MSLLYTPVCVSVRNERTEFYGWAFLVLFSSLVQNVSFPLKCLPFVGGVVVVVLRPTPLLARASQGALLLETLTLEHCYTERDLSDVAKGLSKGAEVRSAACAAHAHLASPSIDGRTILHVATDSRLVPFMMRHTRLRDMLAELLADRDTARACVHNALSNRAPLHAYALLEVCSLG